VVVLVKHQPQTDLAHVVQALDPKAFFLRPRQSWQQHTRQYRDDRNHNQQLDQREGPTLCALQWIIQTISSIQIGTYNGKLS
jgi:hypothetical protein